MVSVAPAIAAAGASMPVIAVSAALFRTEGAVLFRWIH
jgi:hypothetical protein